MFSRILFVSICVFVSSLLASAGEDDQTKEKLFKAKAAYTAELAKLRSEVVAWFDKREEKARSSGNKKLVDEIKLQRELFDDAEDWPLDMPAELRTRLQKARTQVEAAYATAIKEQIRAKKDDEAAATEKALDEFRKDYWPLLDLTAVKAKEGSFRIPPNTSILTKKPYKGGVEIALVAKTEAENIRLYAHRGAAVIFNWEIKPSELRIHRPDGSLGTAQITPLKPNTYYTLKWRFTTEGMVVSVNGVIAFAEKKAYDIDQETKLSIATVNSNVDVKEFKVTPLGK